MAYNPGIVDRSGEILAQSRLAGGMALLGGVSRGIDTFLKKKEEKKNEQEAIAFVRSQFPGIGDQEAKAGLKAAGGAGAFVKFKQEQEQMQKAQQAASYAAMLSQGGGQPLPGMSGQVLNQFSPEVRAMGSDINARRRLEEAKIAQMEAETLALRSPKPTTSTSAQQDTEAIIQAEIAAGKLNANNPQALADRRASLLSLGGRGERETERYQNLGALVDESGNYFGQLVSDQRTGKSGTLDEQTGNINPLPKGVKPSTVSAMSRAVLNGPQFLKLREDLGQAEIALNRLSTYMSSIENSRQGFEKIADKFATNFKTLLSSGNLTKEQLANAAATGQLQALLGANRLEILGGGVLTENDALRIIASAGGDVDALQNKEVVQQAIARMYNDKYRTYKRNREDYNIQVGTAYGSQGYNQADEIEFDTRFLKDAAPIQSTQNTQSALDAARARVEELRRRDQGKKGNK